MAVMIHKNQILSPDSGKYKYISTVLYKTKWLEGSYSFEDIYPSDKYNITIEPDGDTISKELLDEWSKCGITGSLLENKCIAIKKLPEENLPIILGYYRITDIGSDSPFALYPEPTGDIPITSVNLIPKNLLYKVDDLVPVYATLTPEKVTETATFSFSISDTSIVSFYNEDDYTATDNVRIIQGKHAGTATISVTATTNTGNVFRSSCEITVYGKGKLIAPDNLRWGKTVDNEEVIAEWDPVNHAESYDIEVSYLYNNTTQDGIVRVTHDMGQRYNCKDLIDILISRFPNPQDIKDHGSGAFFKVKAFADDYNDSNWSMESALSNYKGV